MYAVISANGKTYGYSHENTLSRLEQAYVDYYRTGLHGDILVKSNGRSIFVEKEK